MYLELQDYHAFAEWTNGEQVILRYTEAVWNEWMMFMRGELDYFFNPSIISEPMMLKLKQDVNREMDKKRIRYAAFSFRAKPS